MKKYIIKKSDPDSVVRRRRDRKWDRNSGEGSLSESDEGEGEEG